MVEIDDLADVVMQAIETAMAPLIARIASLEKRQLVHGRDGRDGKDASVDLDTLALKAAELVPKPRELDEAAAMAALQAQLERTLAAIPKPKDGKDGRDGKDADPDLLKQVVAKLEAVKVMADLNSESVSKLSQRIDERMTKAIEAMPVPQNGRDGKDVDAAMLEVIVAAHVERAVAAVAEPAGRDGVGVSGAVIDHAGVLRLTLSDGKSVECGPVRGADGADGASGNDGVNGIDGAPGAPGKDGADGMKGADGLNGKDGADGLGFDDLEVVLDEAKYCALLRFKRGELVKEFALPWPYDRGVYRAGEKYYKFNFATAQGSLWAAQAETRARPGDGSKDWRLAVKRGRDGKDAVKEPSDG